MAQTPDVITCDFCSGSYKVVERSTFHEVRKCEGCKAPWLVYLDPAHAISGSPPWPNF